MTCTDLETEPNGQVPKDTVCLGDDVGEEHEDSHGSDQTPSDTMS